MKSKIQTSLMDAITDFVFGYPTSGIPAHLLAHSKTAFLDWLGCVIGGGHEPVVQKVLAFSELLGGHEQSSLIGSQRKTGMVHAACVNGASAHILGFDDTSKIYIGHSSAVLFPGLLALAEFKNASGLDFIASHLVAFKVASVLGALAGIKPYQKGWWTTTTVGGVASAAGCSKIMKLNPDQTQKALGIAANMASGIKAVFGSEAKAFHAGYTSGNGIISALLAGEGLTCSDGMLDGSDGYLQVFDGEEKIDVDSLFGEIWEFDHLAQKYHISCHFTHSSIEATLRILAEYKINSHEIKSIHVEASELALKAAGRYEIQSVLDAKFSIPFCISNAVLRKNTGLSMFTEEKIRDPKVLQFMERVQLSSDPSLEPMAAVVTLEKVDGAMISKSVNVFDEIPKIDEKMKRIIHKFSDICKETISLEKIEAIIDRVMNLDRESDVQNFVRRLNENLTSD